MVCEEELGAGEMAAKGSKDQTMIERVLGAKVN